MNKILYIILLLSCLNSFSQDTLTFEVTEEKIIFTEKDIKIDSSTIETRSFEENFKDNYQDSDYIYEQAVKESNWWDRFKKWLADFFKNLFNLSSDTVSGKVVDILIKSLAVLLIVFVIYLIVKSIMNDEGQWIFGKSSDKKVIHYKDVEKNIHLVDFEKLIKETLKSGEQRLSIRYYYLWLLKKMSYKNMIEWDIEKTNSDYLYELKEPLFKSDFEYVSYLYNYIWYGEFELDEPTFEKAKSAFEKIIKSF
ncbi:DUF4129 domain-containing protein [Flavobacterium piscinae]|uniref:DUF4129 domain-containing protein n=2 Tax=Flavobacterium piscinae TaxID=2506424 RepID=A0A4Q1KR80_9FLAO|nr:DUF4129 domain-containing protein [Flavobacterium piscinae]RXR32125.1 DUF4129 domain-containing protein [Flavobacterium piscinae]